MRKESSPQLLRSISELLCFLQLPKAMHPLVALVDYKDIQADTEHLGKGYVLNFTKYLSKNILPASYGMGRNTMTFRKVASLSQRRIRL